MEAMAVVVSATINFIDTVVSCADVWDWFYSQHDLKNNLVTDRRVSDFGNCFVVLLWNF